MRSISRLLAVLRFELVRRRRLLLGGVLAGLLAPLLAWATGAPLGVLAASLGLAVAAGTGLLLGIHAFVPEQLDGRLAFLLLQPLPAAAIPLARGLTASLIGIGQYLLALLPTLALADFATTDASVPFEVLVLGAAAVPAAVFLGSLLAMVLGTRDRWTVLDLAAMAFVTVVLLGLAPSLDSLGLEAVFGLAAIGVVFLALLGAAWGLVAAVSRGRIDARRGHRAFTARLASALLVALAAASLFLAWASSPPSGALAVGGAARTATGNPWIVLPLFSPYWHEGPELLRQGYERSHAFPVAGGKGVALPGEARRAVPLADSSSVVWLADGALHVLDLETGQRSRAAWPSGDPRASSPSPDGRRIAALFSSRDEHGVPRWSAEVRSVDDPVVGHRLELEGVARLDGEARVEWLEHGPRFTVAQEEGLAWFDLPVASDAERPDREMAATGRAGRIDFPSLLRPWGGEPGVLHELSGERSALSTPDEIVVVDRLGDVLWRLPSLRLGGLGPDSAGTKRRFGGPVWRGDHLLWLTLAWTREGRTFELHATSDGEAVTTVALPGWISLGATLADGSGIAVVAPPDSSHERTPTQVGVLRLPELRLELRDAPPPLGETPHNAYFRLEPGVEPRQADQQLVHVDVVAVVRVDFAAGFRQEVVFETGSE